MRVGSDDLDDGEVETAVAGPRWVACFFGFWTFSTSSTVRSGQQTGPDSTHETPPPPPPPPQKSQKWSEREWRWRTAEPWRLFSWGQGLLEAHRQVSLSLKRFRLRIMIRAYLPPPRNRMTPAFRPAFLFFNLSWVFALGVVPGNERQGR
jgi:hypothetical protein